MTWWLKSVSGDRFFTTDSLSVFTVLPAYWMWPFTRFTAAWYSWCIFIHEYMCYTYVALHSVVGKIYIGILDAWELCFFFFCIIYSLIEWFSCLFTGILPWISLLLKRRCYASTYIVYRWELDATTLHEAQISGLIQVVINQTQNGLARIVSTHSVLTFVALAVSLCWLNVNGTCLWRKITSHVVKQWRRHGRKITSPPVNELNELNVFRFTALCLSSYKAAWIYSYQILYPPITDLFYVWTLTWIFGVFFFFKNPQG